MNYHINIPKEAFNTSFRPLLECKKRIICCYGGAGSGKSFFIAQRYIYRMLKQKCNLLVVRNTARSNRDSTFALLSQIIYSWNLNALFQVNKGDLRIKCINGNEIIFAGLDDVEKLKSVTFTNGVLTDIWIEEASEILESDFNQLNIRLRGEGIEKQIVLSFNPIDVNHWLKKYTDNPGEDVEVHHSTYKDNEHLDEEYAKLLESYKDTDPYYYNVYCLGMYGDFNGTCVFSSKHIYERLQTISNPIAKGDFLYDYDGLRISNIRWCENENGAISIYKQPTRMTYVIGGDTAGEGSDYFVGQVLDQSGHQVAVLRQQMDSDLYTKQMYCLGKHYNNALLTIEVNFDSYPIQELQRIGYTNMYLREQNDTALEKYKKSYGFRTDSWTRPTILNRLIELVREHTELFNDKATLEEMLSFTRNEKGRMEAKNGSHDDLVMALAIAYEGMNQLRPYTEKARVFRDDDEKVKSLADYWG